MADKHVQRDIAHKIIRPSSPRLVRSCLPTPLLPPSVDDDAMEVDPVSSAISQFDGDDDEEYIEEARRPTNPG